MAPEGTVGLDEQGNECPRAIFDADGKLVNAEEATGALVSGPSANFEGYYKNPEADAARMKEGRFHTGDLAYRDEAGFFYFAGRDFDWLRVDGENFAAAPVEGILGRHRDIMLAAVYAVPDLVVGDAVMAAVQLRPGAQFNGAQFAEFLSQQSDLGTKWAPTYVRLCEELPITATTKVLKQSLRSEALATTDDLYTRPTRSGSYLLMSEAEKADLTQRLSSLAQRSEVSRVTTSRLALVVALAWALYRETSVKVRPGKQWTCPSRFRQDRAIPLVRFV